MNFIFLRRTAFGMLLLAAAGQAAAQAPAADYAAYPCLSYSLECGRLATRRPQLKQLDGVLNGNAEKGKQLAQARNGGNCLACHAMKGGSQPGTRGPDLSHYGNAGRSDAETYSMVHDMRTRNPDTLMPPFGTNAILSDPEIRDIVAFLQASK